MKNDLFNGYVKTIIDGARQFMADPDMRFGFRAYMLLGENQSRVFKLSIEDIMSRDYIPPPEEGRYVGLISGHGQNKDKLILVFSEFPAGKKVSEQKGALAYRPDELNKAAQHLTDWIERTTLPVADEE